MANQKVTIFDLPQATGFGPNDYLLGSQNGATKKIPGILVGASGSGATGATGPTGPAANNQDMLNNVLLGANSFSPGILNRTAGNFSSAFGSDNITGKTIRNFTCSAKGTELSLYYDCTEDFPYPSNIIIGIFNDAAGTQTTFEAEVVYSSYNAETDRTTLVISQNFDDSSTQGYCAPLGYGDYSSITGQFCLALGNFSRVNGAYSFAYGDFSEANGNECSAEKDYGKAEGNYTISKDYGERTLGFSKFEQNGDNQVRKHILNCVSQTLVNGIYVEQLYLDYPINSETMSLPNNSTSFMDVSILGTGPLAYVVAKYRYTIIKRNNVVTTLGGEVLPYFYQSINESDFASLVLEEDGENPVWFINSTIEGVKFQVVIDSQTIIEVPNDQKFCTIKTGYYQVNRNWMNILYSYELVNCVFNETQYATGQSLNIYSATDVVVGTGIDGQEYVMNINDWINSILPSDIRFYDDMRSVTCPSDATFTISITDKETGTVYIYDNTGLSIMIGPTTTHQGYYVCETV